MNYLVEEKDLMLSFICKNTVYDSRRTVYYRDFPIKDKQKIKGIMLHFQRLGLVSEVANSLHTVGYLLHYEAVEFLSKGGFKVQEELLQANIEKLLLEIESLKPSMPDRVETLTTIASNILNALGVVAGVC